MGKAKVRTEPINKRVMVEPFAAEDKSEGGIYIPDTAKAEGMDGIAVEVAKDCEAVKKGDHVLFQKYSGTEVLIDGTKYRFVLEEDLLGVIRG